jgi:16S rRNA (cytosine967-C5)-methyltransferase
MAGQKLKSARTIAVEVLNHYDPKKDYANLVLDGLHHETDQRQRATDLVFGTLRNRRAIDTVITKFSGRPVKRIQEKLLNIIQIGTYELIYCPSTEQYAIVNEAVANAKAAGTARQSGFVNAVLRQIARHISNRRIPLSKGNAGNILPQTPMTGCQFDTAFLPDRQERPAEYLSMVFSLPEWLVAGWLAEFGEESTRQICFASNRRPSIYVRPNPLKTTIEALTEKLRDAGIDLEVNAEDSMIRIISPRTISQLPGFAEGEFSVQDISASKPVRMLNPRPGWKILDLCAAPGTKTAQLAEMTGDLPHEIKSLPISRGEAKIIATDIDSRRLEMVMENITRLGINSVDIVPYEKLLGISDFRLPNVDFQIENRISREGCLRRKIENSFDCILLDVPCSNTGVLTKRIEVRYRIEPKVIRELAGLQSKLLCTAAKMLKQGGLVCYSTCSIQKTENNELVENFLKKNQDFTLESQQLTLPTAEGFDHDGGYAAILVKRERSKKSIPF